MYSKLNLRLEGQHGVKINHESAQPENQKLTVIDSLVNLLMGLALSQHNCVLDVNITLPESGKQYIATLANDFKLHIKQPVPDVKLTPREREIGFYICKGWINKEISERLCIQYHTVRKHRQNICNKFGVSCTAGLIDELLKLKLAAPIKQLLLLLTYLLY